MWQVSDRQFIDVTGPAFTLAKNEVSEPVACRIFLTQPFDNSWKVVVPLLSSLEQADALSKIVCALDTSPAPSCLRVPAVILHNEGRRGQDLWRECRNAICCRVSSTAFWGFGPMVQHEARMTGCPGGQVCSRRGCVPHSCPRFRLHAGGPPRGCAREADDCSLAM